jgi:hypothetical protein
MYEDANAHKGGKEFVNLGVSGDYHRNREPRVDMILISKIFCAEKISVMVTKLSTRH